MMENERFNYILKRKKKLKLEFNFLIYLVFLLLLKPTVLESEPSLFTFIKTNCIRIRTFFKIFK